MLFSHVEVSMPNRIVLSVLRERTPAGAQDTCTLRLAELLRLTDPEPQDRPAPGTPLILELCGGLAHFTPLCGLPAPGLTAALQPCAGVLTLDGEASLRVIQGAQTLAQLRADHTEHLALGATPVPVLLRHPREGAHRV